MNKKAALQLSINAIVVLILAITILGLGLGFIKSQFGALTKQFSAVSEEIEGEIKQRIRDSGELLIVSKETVRVKGGKKEEFFIGIKNVEPEPICYKVSFVCIQALKTANSCGDYVDRQGTNNIVVAGFDLLELGGQDVDPKDAWMETFFTKTIKESVVDVRSVSVQIPGRVKGDTYLMELEVYKGDSEDCEAANFEPYEEKEFIIELSK